MPRNFGGHTQLGVELNRQNQKNSHSFTKKVNFKKAVIVKSFKNLYIFTMRLSESGKITRPIPLLGSTEELSMRYGSPEEMEGVWEVMINYMGDSVNRGTATILGRYGATIDQEVEETEQANQLLIKGSAFAPPGSGM